MSASKFLIHASSLLGYWSSIKDKIIKVPHYAIPMPVSASRIGAGGKIAENDERL